MDRNKSTQGNRGPKAKISQQLPDSFIALGAKSGSSRDDSKRTIPLPKTTLPSTGTVSSDKLKREGSSSSLAVPPSKKLKVGLSGAPRPSSSSSAGGSLLPIERMAPSSSAGIEPWESLAIEYDINEVFDKILPYIQAQNIDKSTGYVLGILKGLRSNKTKPCKITWTTLFSLASMKPELFSSENVINAMVNILRRDISAGLKGIYKNNTHMHQMLLNLICYVFGDTENWPDVFVKLYVEDAIGDRMIIDSPFAKPFVDNLTTSFHTKVPPSSLLKSETWTSAARDTSSPVNINNLEEDDGTNEQKSLVEGWQIKVIPRYAHTQEKVEQIVLEAIKDLLARRQQPESISKNFVRLLSTACGLNEIRVLGVSRIEAWLHNHKLMKPAQELLAYICYNCSANSQRDLEVIAQLSKLRLKNKPMVNYFNNCLREMVFAFNENLYPLLKYTIYNELSNARNPNNLIVVGALFQVRPDHAADALADICLELLLNKDDYLRSLRALLKEINRVLRHDFNLLSVVHALLRERKDLLSVIREHEFRERIFYSLVDLTSMSMLLCVSPQVRDAATQSKRDLTILKTFKTQVSNIQRECVTWLHDSALRIFRPNVPDFHHALLKVLFLEQAEHYYKVDAWPGENERNLFLRLASEVPLLQATLLRILLIGISKEHPITANEIIDIQDELVKRAANLSQDCGPTLLVDKVEILDFFFTLCSYNYPENITLPHGYVSPKLAISNHYWRVWMILLILSAHNPLTIGSLTWNKYPTLRMFMEMCITNYFSFPPPTMITAEEDYQSKELQTLALEKQTILEFESHLAAASTKAEINEQTSLLLPQLMELNPFGDARRPPAAILDVLQTLNNSHRLGHLLCKSRHPDFLLDIMSRQGSTHMPWLADLVHSAEGVLNHLPVQCLCEYLLSTAPAEKLTKHGQLLAHLRTVVNGPDSQSVCEVLEYLFRRLTSDHGASRIQATKGLSLILSPNQEEDTNETYHNWLSQYIVQFSHFSLIKPALVQFLRQALQIETNPIIVSSYINFLATQECYETFSELNDLITDLSSFIIERHSVASYVLPGDDNGGTLKSLLELFYVYTVKAKENFEESYTIHQSYNNEYVIVQWGNGEQCAMQSLVIHAAIVLLTYGPLIHFEPFNVLLNVWFPLNMEHPRAYSPDTSETTTFLPDWIKLRMIRSNVERLADAAIEKLEPPKLILFIQSFGIPTNSISKLLNTLDKATIMDQKLIVDSVLDKTYMIQLVQVQNKRRALGGEIFVKSIEMEIPPVEEIDVGIEVDTKKSLEFHKIAKSTDATRSNYLDLENLFNPYFNGDKDKLILHITKNLCIKKNYRKVFDFLKSLPTNNILEAMVIFDSFATLLSLIFTNGKNFDEEKEKFAIKILPLLPPSNCCLKVLKRYLKTKKSTKRIIDIELTEFIQSDDLITSNKSEVLNIKANLGGKLAKMLLDDETDIRKTGLLVDWLSAVELEIASSEKDKFQVDLLFSKKDLPFRPLLISLLLQRGSWQSLQNLVNYLVSKNAENICAISVLDFLTALIKSPKLWQGRDKAVPKHAHFEDVLKLNQSQVEAIIRFIIEEAGGGKMKMESRLQHLLLRCIGNHAPKIVNLLYQQIEGNHHARELLLMIYMSLPYSGQKILNLKPETTREIAKLTCSSAIDKIAHCLLSALSATPRQTKDWDGKSKDLELCARKLTATHPMLVLRHLPMIAGSLKGRAQFEWSVLKARGHFQLFLQVLGLIELMQPYIFHQTDQTMTLCDLLGSFFMLLNFHSQRNELAIIVKRLVLFIQNWMVQDVRAGSKFLQEHGGILNDIQFNQEGVRPLLSSVSLPISYQNSVLITASNSDILMVGVVTAPAAEIYPERWSQYKQALQTADNLNALQEIDLIANKRPQLLKNIAQNLYWLLQSPSGATRKLALSLIIKWLKFNPRASSDALSAVLSCLQSENPDVVNSLFERLPDLIPLMQEYARLILTKVFQLGMKSVLGTTSNITKSIDLLYLQYGC